MQRGLDCCHACCPFPGATKGSTLMQRGLDCLSGSKTTAGLVSIDAFARPKNATPSPPRSSHFHPWWCTPRVLLGCLGGGRAVVGAPERVDIDLAHRHHGLHGAAGALAVGAA